MKVYLTCYVWGDGYTTKCFDSVKQEVLIGSHTMNDQERTLFVRSNARLLLASVGTRRFGFVRQIDAQAKDENGRKCVINLALAGNGGKVDGIIAMAAERYPEFAQAVREMIYYVGTEFMLDWKKFQALAGYAEQKRRNGNSSKPVTLLCAEPSIGYFIKNCGMGWRESDIETQLDLRMFSERERKNGGGSVSGRGSDESRGAGDGSIFKVLSDEDRRTGNGLTSKALSDEERGSGDGSVSKALFIEDRRAGIDMVSKVLSDEHEGSGNDSVSKALSDMDGEAGNDMIAKILSEDEKVSEIFRERNLEMRLYIYCATPSMGYVLREIDSRTGDILHEEKEARKMIPGELLAMIDNSGCRMALFHVGGRECFVAKEVKADAVNQYGQRTTVCVAAVSTGNEKIVRQMAIQALLNYDAFRIKLTDCVKVSAGTVGYTVDGDKLQQLIRSIQEPVHFAPTDPCHAQWDILMGENSRKYTFLVMDTSLDYFCRSTGLDVSKQQVFYICPENVLGASSGELAEAFRTGTAKIGMETFGTKSVGTKSSDEGESGTKSSKTGNTGGSSTKTSKIGDTGSDGTNVSKTGTFGSEDSISSTRAKFVRAKEFNAGDAIDLLETPVFRAALGVFAFVLVVLLSGIMIYKILHK